MPKQQLELIDYFGPLAAWIVFFSIVFIISVTCILWCCVGDKDDETVFAKYGMGPAKRRQPRRQNEYAMTATSAAKDDLR